MGGFVESRCQERERKTVGFTWVAIGSDGEKVVFVLFEPGCEFWGKRNPIFTRAEVGGTTDGDGRDVGLRQGHGGGGWFRQ